MNTINWPFQDPENVAIITTKQVIEDDFPILRITHDEDDGGWQILCGTTNNPDDARVTSLKSLYDRDSSIGEVAHLPLGWIAKRESKGSPWKTAKK